MKKLIANLEWLRDDCGEYWVADLFKGHKKIGVTGTYYDLNENGERLSRNEQEAELKNEFVIMQEFATNTG